MVDEVPAPAPAGGGPQLLMLAKPAQAQDGHWYVAWQIIYQRTSTQILLVPDQALVLPKLVRQIMPEAAAAAKRRESGLILPGEFGINPNGVPS